MAIISTSIHSGADDDRSPVEISTHAASAAVGALEGSTRCSTTTELLCPDLLGRPYRSTIQKDGTGNCMRTVYRTGLSPLPGTAATNVDDLCDTRCLSHPNQFIQFIL